MQLPNATFRMQLAHKSPSEKYTLRLLSGEDLTGYLHAVGEDFVKFVVEDKGHTIPFSAIAYVRPGAPMQG